MAIQLDFYYGTAESSGGEAGYKGLITLYVDAPGAAAGHVHDALSGSHDTSEPLRLISIDPEADLPDRMRGPEG